MSPQGREPEPDEVDADDQAAADVDPDEAPISPAVPLTGRDVLRADLLEPPSGKPTNEPPYEE